MPNSRLEKSSRKTSGTFAGCVVSYTEIVCNSSAQKVLELLRPVKDGAAEHDLVLEGGRT